MKRLLAALGALLLPSPASAAGLELVGYIGPIISPYDQSIQLDPGGLILPGGAVIPTGQALRLEATGGSSLGGALTLYLADWIGLELRLDAAKLDIEATGATYRVVLDLPAPLPDASGDLELGSGPVEMERIHPFSLNLKLRTPGRVALVLSGGLSYLGDLRLATPEAARLRAAQVPGVPAGSVLAAVGLRAVAVPEREENGRYGANAGLGLQFALGEHIALVGEARGFIFQEHRLEWERDDGPLSPLSEALAEELERRLGPVDFNPNFFQITAGLSVSF